MGLLMKSTPVLILLLTFVNYVAADAYYIGPTIGGIVGLIILILDIIAIVEVLRSGKPMVEKLLWILFILIFPIIGLLVYFFFVVVLVLLVFKSFINDLTLFVSFFYKLFRYFLHLSFV